MKTAEEMYDYICSNNLGKGISQSWNLKHLKVIEEQLNVDEDVICCFIGLHNFGSATKHNQNFAYAITNSRFIMGQKKLIGENVQSVLRKNLNDITKNTGVIYGTITFDTIRERFTVGIDSSTIDRVYELINEVLFQSKKKDDPIDRLKKLKILLDMGAITRQDYESKKNKILEEI